MRAPSFLGRLVRKGVTESVTPNPIAANIDKALATRRAARMARAQASAAGQRTRKANAVPDPVVSTWGAHA